MLKRIAFNDDDPHRITAGAYAAIKESLPTAGNRPPQKEGDLYLVSVPNDTMDKLMALRRPSESYSDVIVRLATEARS